MSAGRGGGGGDDAAVTQQGVRGRLGRGTLPQSGAEDLSVSSRKF